MSEPLTRSQQQLRGRKVSDMTVEQLKDWIHACHRMEVSVSHNKARRSWKDSRTEAAAELIRRLEAEDK